MSTNTYVALKTYTVSGSSTYAVTLDTIPTTGYSDLVLVMSIKCAVDTNQPYVQFNTDLGTSTTNYSTTVIRGDGSSATSGRHTNNFAWYPVPGPGVGTANNFHIWEMNIQNYSNATTYKTGLSRYNNASSIVTGNVHLWRQTAAINSITITSEGGSGAYFVAGSTFTVYGIANADVGAYATGGIITQDANYYYHAFGNSSYFTPTRNLTADILVVAGGGGGGTGFSGGGGGAGGLRALASQSLTNGTGYSCTVGAGGNGGTPQSRGGTGGTTTFNTISVSGGGGGSASNTTAGNGSSGGGGSGDGTNASGGTGNAGSYSPVEGYAGGASGNANSGGGGGGAGGIGGTSTSTLGGGGGAGVSTYNSIDFSNWLSASGLGVSGLLAGGGGGSGRNTASGANGSAGGGAGGTGANGNNALASTGSGGGGGASGSTVGGNGGSGLIIVRYSK